MDENPDTELDRNICEDIGIECDSINIEVKESLEGKSKRGGGRPPHPSRKIDLAELGKEMLQWVINNSPTHLSEWYSIRKMITYKTWKALIVRNEFRPYYERALSIVALNSRNGTLDKSIAQRFLSLYHKDLKEEERDTAEHNARIKVIAEVQTQENLASLKKSIEKGDITQE